MYMFLFATEHSQVYTRLALPPQILFWTLLTAMSDLLTAMSDFLTAMSDLLTGPFFRLFLFKIILFQICPVQECPFSNFYFQNCTCSEFPFPELTCF